MYSPEGSRKFRPQQKKSGGTFRNARVNASQKTIFDGGPSMKRTLMMFVAACAATTGLALAQAASGTTQPQNWRGRAYLWLTNQLDLTEAQKSQAKETYRGAWQNAKPVMEQLRQNRKAMSEAIKANDMAKIRQLAATQGDLTGQVTALRAESQAQFYQVLTPDQRAKMATIEQNMRTRFQQRAQWRQR
jgi:Spy/CpxP family protein refolding chaperone